jgi:cob(I)alamin adenosyltransferase
LESLKQLGVQVIRSETSFGFTWNMDDATKEACKREQEALFAAACAATDADLLILDEVVDALGDDMIEASALAAFLRDKPSDLEVVLTGHKEEDWLSDVADYVTEMKKVKHPFDEGVRARRAIEF